jgi:hypothetical protein
VITKKLSSYPSPSFETIEKLKIVNCQNLAVMAFLPDQPSIVKMAAGEDARTS